MGYRIIRNLWLQLRDNLGQTLIWHCLHLRQVSPSFNGMRNEFPFPFLFISNQS